MKKISLALIFGGISSERDISLESGEKVLAALDKDKYTIRTYDPKYDLKKLVNDAPNIDAALIILHGAYGEDGTVQGLLDLFHIPYQGAGVLGSSLAMNKLASKLMYEQFNIPTPPYCVIKRGDTIHPATIEKELGLPLFVKPAVGGSSIGMSLVKARKAIEPAIQKALDHDRTIIVESYIKGCEITCGILGNDDLTALPLVEIIPNASHDFFDYEAKYSAEITKEICPARISQALTEKAQELALLAHEALFLRGYSRTDMIVRGDKIFVLETNTIPGMTETSLLPQSAKVAGISFPKLLDQLIALSLEDLKTKP